MAQAVLMDPPEMEDITGMDLSVGEILRRSRLHYNLSLSDVERELHIKAPQIEAIESDHFELLPGKVYAVGFIRSYAEYLRLDADKMVRLFKVQGIRQPEDPTLNFPVCASESKLPSFWTLVLSGLALVGVLIAWNIDVESGRFVSSVIPDVPERLQNAGQVDSLLEALPTSKAGVRTSSVSYGPYLPGKIATAVVDPSAKGIRLHVIHNSWVEIRNAERKTLVSRILKKGEQYLIPKKEGLTITIGNAGGVILSIDGQQLNSIGENGQVVRQLPLDASYLMDTFGVDE